MEEEGICTNSLCLTAEEQNNLQLTSVIQTLGSKFEKSVLGSRGFLGSVWTCAKECREGLGAQPGVELTGHTTFMLMRRTGTAEDWKAWFKLVSFLHLFIHSMYHS